MENIHLNYDGIQGNGIIFNDEYTWGALYTDKKPDLGFQYKSMQYSEVFDAVNYVIVNETKEMMSAETEELVRGLAIAWQQTPNQEGGSQWLLRKAEYERIGTDMTEVCTSALVAEGYSTEQIRLFFPQYQP